MLQINLPTYIISLSCLIPAKPSSQPRANNELFGIQKFKAASALKSLSCPVQLSVPFFKILKLSYILLLTLD